MTSRGCLLIDVVFPLRTGRKEKEGDRREGEKERKKRTRAKGEKINTNYNFVEKVVRAETQLLTERGEGKENYSSEPRQKGVSKTDYLSRDTDGVKHGATVFAFTKATTILNIHQFYSISVRRLVFLIQNASETVADVERKYK